MSQLLWSEHVGSGAPVVLLHPLALSSRIWSTFADALSRRFEVWLVDLRGHGRSGWDGQPFTLFDMAADVSALLDHAGRSPVSLVGMSMGGGVAMSVAALHPDRVAGLVLADTTAWYGPDAQAAWEKRAQRALETPRSAHRDLQAERWFTDAFRAAHADVVERVFAEYAATDGLAHAAACRAMGAFDARDRLAAIAARTLVLVGEEDYATPPEFARTLADAIPSSTLTVIPRARHLSLVERPDLADIVGAHLSQL
ncbi:MAG: alpha/beta fold hydrolase [Chloroflexota bacterium]|nr:alpha/beta fold hydrolase [Chloroflexota bacterium]MDE3100702.1 alpha/beta fold hydrolase [Chloroflexota bacterium]